MELLRASNSGVGPAPKRPPHSLCDGLPAGRVDDGTVASAIVMARSEGVTSDSGKLARRLVGSRRLGRLHRGELLIPDGADSRRQGEEANEARRVALLIDVILAEGDEALVVQRVVALATDDGDR